MGAHAGRPAVQVVGALLLIAAVGACGGSESPPVPESSVGTVQEPPPDDDAEAPLVGDATLAPTEGWEVLGELALMSEAELSLLGAEGSPDGYCLTISDSAAPLTDDSAIRGASCATERFLSGESNTRVVALGTTSGALLEGALPQSSYWFALTESPIESVSWSSAVAFSGNAVVAEIPSGAGSEMAIQLHDGGTVQCVPDLDISGSPICR